MFAMAIVAVIYISVAITAVSVVPWYVLADSKNPLTDVIRLTAPAIPPKLFSTIALFSITNTILVNYVTASRLLYGMAHQKLLPSFLGEVHVGRRTPHIAVFVLFILFLPAVIFGSIAKLAATSVLLLLTVFTIMNISLVKLQKREGEAKGKFEIAPIFPMLGAIVCVILIIARAVTGEWTAPAFAAAIVAAIMCVHFVTKKRLSN
jgi:amino acid transporter